MTPSPNDVEVHPWTRPSWGGPDLHASVYEWVGKTVAEHELGALATLEVGSGIVNGTVRDYFSGPYVGVDIGAGSGVDRVEDCTNLSDGDNTWDVVISTEMLEHVDAVEHFLKHSQRNWWLAVGMSYQINSKWVSVYIA